MGITIYHFPPSAPSRIAVLVARALGLDVDVQIVDLFAKEQFGQDFVKINPQHCVPTLVDGDFVLWESRAIAVYLIEKYGKDSSLYPKDVQKKGLINQRLYFDCGTLYPRIRAVCFPILYLGEIEILHELKLPLEEALGFLDVFLEGNNFACGDKLTLADISLAASVSSIVAIGWDLNPYANVSAWISRCALEIPGYAEINQKGADAFGKAVRKKLAPGQLIKMNLYSVIGKIGEGAHGYVMKGVSKITGTSVALKKLIIKNLDEGIPVNVMREIASLRVLHSEQIVKMLDVIPHGMGFILIMEYLPSSLDAILHDKNISLNESQIKYYTKMLLLGVKYMHEHHIMHRDLKPANLLIAKNGALKIADFGLARIYSQNEPNRKYSHQVATRWYRAPELLYGSHSYTPAIDMWSVGCILAELYKKTPLLPGQTDIEQLAIVIRTLGTPTEETWPGLSHLPDYNKITFSYSKGVSWNVLIPNAGDVVLDLIENILIYNSTLRLTANEAINHPYFLVAPFACSVQEMPKPENIKQFEFSNFEDFDFL